MKVKEPESNYTAGWVKIYRSIWNKGWYRKSDYVHLWYHILLKANHSQNEWLYKGKILKVMRGQFITSRRSLANETGINEMKIERILKCFKSEQQIEQQNFYSSRLITIINYDAYQKSEQQNEQQMYSKCTASEQQMYTNKNEKNEKKRINDSKKFSEIDNAIVSCYRSIKYPINRLLLYKTKYDNASLARKFFFFKFMQRKGGLKNPHAWLESCLREDYSETDEFLEGWKSLQDEIYDSNCADYIKLAVSLL